jgi:ParB family chromosome partitioning protein
VNLIKAQIQKDKEDLLAQAVDRDRGYNEIPIETIQVKSNPRKKFESKSIRQLADSIAKDGLLQPILVDSDYNLIAGERRLRACKFLDMKTIRTIIYDGNNKDPQIISILENIQREDLSSIELGQACYELKTRYNWKQKDIAKHLHKSEGHISELLKFYKNFDASKRSGSINKNRGKTSKTQLSFNFRFVLAEKYRQKMTPQQYNEFRLKLKELEEAKNYINNFVEKLKKQ